MTGRLIVATVTNMSACTCAIVTGCLSIVCTPPATLRRPHAVSGRTPIKKSSCKYYKLANNDRNIYDNIHWQVWVTWNDLIGYFWGKNYMFDFSFPDRPLLYCVSLMGHSGMEYLDRP